MLANPLMQSINNPMTVNSYLTNRASNAILSTGEQDSINRSVATLQTRLNSYFQSLAGSGRTARVERECPGVIRPSCSPGDPTNGPYPYGRSAWRCAARHRIAHLTRVRVRC
jgi:hypothetical protein